ncbi:MAG: TonB-dependent receptor [Proteobacteria bacterium]|uniref:TonB-dependent receptor domain-containing protein n=1 Tax=Rudaea sp. TaxID=2136325 RepID=UPI003783C645|nr:TonB-dependent receptor [Pseudomonadota bacterium]
MSSSRHYRIALTRLSVALAAVLAAVPLAAQEASPDKDKNDDKKTTTQMERIEVTGSNIKRTDIETASPLQIISKAEIESMGARTLLQVLDNLPAARPAQQDFKSLFTGSDGASQANLRGLGAQGTLVLLNGRRLSYYGAPAGFQTQFVNIDAIPAAAIERMEVLTDGASAVYGTDAVAGVINVITRQAYQGAELSLSSDSSSRIGTYGEHQASITAGTGNLAEDRYNVYGSINLYRRDPIPLSDWYDKKPAQFYVNNPNYIKNFRLDTGSAPGVFNPGSYFAFDPKTGARVQEAAPGCNNKITEAAGTRCVWQTWLNNQIDAGAQSDRATGYLHGTFQLTDSLQAFGEVTYTDIDLKANGGTPRAFNTTTGNPTSWFARNTGSSVNKFFYPFLGPNNEYNHASPGLKALMGGVVGLQYLLQDVGSGYFGQHNTDESYRALAGLRGNFGDWDWESALTTAGSASVTYQTVNVNLEGFKKAFGPFTIDPGTGRVIISDHPAYQFGVISDANAALLRAAYPTFDIRSWTRLTTWDGKIEGPLATLPAGEMRAAFGFSVARESFYTPGNTDAANGLITQQGGSFFNGKRTTGAVFGEAVAPITDKIEVDGALRVDKYPNFDANVAPKFGIKYQVVPEFLLRGTYSEGFRAPSLAESGVGGIFAQLGGYRDPTRCSETNAIANLLLQSKRAGDVDLGNTLLNSDCSRTVARVTQPNPDLQPEKAKISTLGFVFEPTKQLSVSADYWFIYRRNEIAAPDYTKPADIISSTRFDITDTDRANMAAVAAMCADPASGVVCPGTLPTYTVGNVASVVGRYKNRGRTLVDGFDIDARARFPLDRWGKLTLGVAATIARRTDTILYDPSQGLDYGNVVGWYNNPRLRATLNADWNYGNWTTSLFVNYTGKTKWGYDQTDVDNAQANCTAGYLALPSNLCGGVPAWWTANLGVTWKPVERLQAGLTIKNLFNRLPFYDPNSFLGDASDYTNNYGRIYSVSLTYKFL